jgi:hypothetical protein
MENFDFDIQKYNFKDLLSLFKLNDSYITEDDLKKSKNIVLQMHPDKSSLSSEYFIFYKKAFEMLLEIYNKQTRISQEITIENTKYKDLVQNQGIDKQIKEELGKMKNDEFNLKFNELFENIMVTEKSPEINDWFTNEKSSYETNTSTNVNEGIQYAKKIQSLNNIVKYKGFKMLQSSLGTDLYINSLMECCPSSNGNLQYEDITRVHRDESIFTYNESDFESNLCMTIDDLQEKRDNQDLIPMDKLEAEKILKLKDKSFFDDISNKEYASKLETNKYEEKNKSVLSYFLRLTSTKIFLNKKS